MLSFCFFAYVGKQIKRLGVGGGNWEGGYASHVCPDGLVNEILDTY